MGRVRINRDGFVAGILSREAQAQSESAEYNRGLDIANNCIIKPLGGAWKRSGTIYYDSENSSDINIFQFPYSAGEYCLVILSSGGIEFVSLRLGKKTDKVKPDQFWDRSDVRNVQAFCFENKLYLYCPAIKKDDAPSREDSVYFLFESIPRPEIKNDFNIVKVDKPSKFVNNPFSPMWPSRNIKVISSNPIKIGLYSTDPNQLEVGLFTEHDIGRQLLIYNISEAGDQWPIFNITVANFEEAEVTLMHADGTGIVPPIGYTTDKWFISAFTGSGTNNGRLGTPIGQVIHEGRLYLYKNETIIGSRLDGFPLDFRQNSKDDSAIHKLAPASIFWAVSSSRLFLGCSDGIYIVGGSSSNNNSGISQRTIGVANLSRVVPSKLPPMSSGDGVLFVGADNCSVWMILFTEQGIYSTVQINQACEHLTASGIVSHAIQRAPYTIYWAVTGGGNLVSCVIAQQSPRFRWTTHTIGGPGAFVLKIWTSNEGEKDVVWVLVRRHIGGVSKYYIEYLTDSFEKNKQKVENLSFLDCSKIKVYPTPVVDITLGDDYFLETSDEVAILSEEFVSLLNSDGRLKLFLSGVNIGGLKNVMYCPYELYYRGITRATFSVNLDTEKNSNLQKICTIKNFDMASEMFRYMDIKPLFKKEITILKIENIANNSVYPGISNSVVITFSDTLEGYIFFGDMYVSFDNIGNISLGIDPELDLDNNIYRLHQESETSFSLLKYSNGTYIDSVINEEAVTFNKLLKADFYIGESLTDGAKWVQPGREQSVPTITFGLNWYSGQGGARSDFNEFGDGDKSIWHNVFIESIHGAPQFDGQKFRLNPDKLVEHNGEMLPRYFMYHWPKEFSLTRLNNEDDVDIAVYRQIKLFPSTVGAGLPENYGDDIGRAFWMFSDLTKKDLEFLLGTACYFAGNGVDLEVAKILDDTAFDSNGLLFLGDEFYSICVGYRYQYELYLTPLMGGSAYGSSEGTLGNQRQILLTVYRSIGGNYSSSPDRRELLYPIDYSNNPGEIDAIWGEYTGIIKLGMDGNLDPTIRSLYLLSDEAQNFVALTAIQDITVNDDS